MGEIIKNYYKKALELNGKSYHEVGGRMLCYIILNYNDYETTYNCVKSLINFETISKIIVVDNNSPDGSYLKLKDGLASEKIDVIQKDHNGGYGFGNNYGIRFAINKYSPEIIVVSNPDVEISEKTIRACEDYLLHSDDNIIVAPLMQNIDGSFNYDCVWKCPTYYEYLMFSLSFGKKFDFHYSMIDYDCESFDCECVAGSWLMIHPERFESIGMYDENIFLYCEETSVGIRAKKAGYRTTLLPQESFVHKHPVSISKSIKSEYTQQKMMWKSRLYMLDNYYKRTCFRKFISRVIFGYAMIERRIIHFLRLLKRHRNFAK